MKVAIMQVAAHFSRPVPNSNVYRAIFVYISVLLDGCTRLQ